jgi:3-phosphoshikimate 1-carboxyvinyltransferase
MQYGLIGEKLGHSFSKEIHNLLGDYQYELKEIAPSEIDTFMTQKNFSGINVTIPYKQTVIPYLDEIEENARKIGAVNTVVNRNGKLYGYNTDFYGMKALIEKTDISVSGKNVLILGTGGTSNTASVLVQSLGAKSVYKVSRHAEAFNAPDKCISYEEAYKKAETQIIINTTPSGMFPKTDAQPITLNDFPNLEGLIDVIYNPDCTKLVLEAKSLGIKTSGGLYMLVMQAVKAYELFFDTKIENHKADEIFEKIHSGKKNIVLVGMPSSGKTTVGKIIAKLSGREFVDSDDEIVKEENRKITDIFSSDGEKYFRSVESAVISKIALKTSCVISTGGGAVLDFNNVKNLKMNGKIYFLDRPLEKLVPTADRPTAFSMQKLTELYEKRFPLYSKICDVCVNANDTPEKIADFIIRDAKLENAVHKNIVKVKPSRANGSVEVPPSKSLAHRAIICALLAEGQSKITNVEFSEDVLATLDCIKAFGAKCEIENNTMKIEGIGNNSELISKLKLNCRESGSTLRFFIPISLVFAKKAEFSGSKVLLNRPQTVYEKQFSEKNIHFEKTSESIKISGKLSSGKYFINGNVSSQFITGLLFALPLLSKDSELELIPPVESRPYIDLTVQMLNLFGIEVCWKSETLIYIKGNQKYKATDYTVEGDYSNAAFLDAFNTIGGKVQLKGLSSNSLQGDRVYKQMFDSLVSGCPVLDISDCPDLGPVLFVIAALHNGAVFNGTKRLAIKESNRGKIMCEELEKFGISSEQSENQIIIHKGKIHSPQTILRGYNDHRIVMSLIVLLSVTGGMIDDGHAVNKSFPSFYEKLKILNVEFDRG